MSPTTTGRLSRWLRRREPAPEASDAGRPATDGSATAVRRTFRSDELQLAFERDGYVVARVLDDIALEGLLASYAQMEHHHQDWLPFAEGFHTTLYDGRHDYRAQVADAFEEWLWPGLDRVLDDHRLQFANFQVKLPDAETLPEHIDWTFVDERVARSVTVWCATHDIDATNGGLGVAPASHLLVDFDRAVNHRYYEAHSAVAAGIADRPVIGLRPGEALIFDNRLLHFSTPNPSAQQRLAASCVASPAEQPVVHYWFDEHDVAHRIEVTPEFWLWYRIGEDPRSFPGAVADSAVSGGSFA